MTKIGYVLKVYPRLSQTFIVNELRAHERAGQELVIFSLKPPRESDVGVVDPPLSSPVIYLSGGQEDWPEELARLAKQHEVNHLHAHFGNIAAQTANAAASLAGIPYTFTAHALDIYDKKVDQQLLAKKIRQSAAVITVSQYNVRHIRETFGRRAVLIYNGMPLDDIPYRPEGHDKALILAVGRLIEKKGFDVLIQACANLHRRGEPFHCEIIGDGPLETELRNDIQHLGITEQVRLLGPLRPDQVKQKLQQATLLAAPCVVAASGDRDGLPTVLLEAMATGTPCISTDVTGIPEVIIDHDTGLQVPQRDANALAEACLKLLDDPLLARQLADRARALIEQSFDSDRTAAQLRQLWRNPQRRILFRIHNRKGMGHWMRCSNIANELLAQSPDTDILFYARTSPPFTSDPRIGYLIADDPERMELTLPAIQNFAPHLVVDDTILKSDSGSLDYPRAFILRKLAEAKHRELLDSDALRAMQLVIVPHTREEFGYKLPDWLEQKTLFVGPIVRQPSDSLTRQLREKYLLKPDQFLLISTPGGGGFYDDANRFFETVSLAHKLLDNPHLRHIVVRGPNASVTLQPVDERMTVVDSEPALSCLFGIADAIVSAGGYNSVSEIRLAKRPAIFIPGERKYDDQLERVNRLQQAGLAWVMTDLQPAAVAEKIARMLSDPKKLNDVHKAYEQDRFVPGNSQAAEALLQCAR